MKRKGRKTTDRLEGSRGMQKKLTTVTCAKHFESQQQLRMMPTKSLRWLVSLPQMQEKMFTSMGVTDNKTAIATDTPEEVPVFATCVTQARRTVPLPLGRHAYIPPISLPYHTVYSSWRTETLARCSRLSSPHSLDFFYKDWIGGGENRKDF